MDLIDIIRVFGIDAVDISKLTNLYADCIFVAEPVEEKEGFVMYHGDYVEITDKRWKQYGTDCYTMKSKIDCYNELKKHKLFDLTFEQWKQIPKPRMFRADY